MYGTANVFSIAQVCEAKGEKVTCALDIAEQMADQRKNAQEGFWVLTLTQKHKVIAVHLVSLGTLTASLVHPRECFRPALLDSAAAVAFVHNHPSGETQPSLEDRNITARLKQAGELLGIVVLDHVIIGYGADGALAFCSMAEEGAI